MSEEIFLGIPRRLHRKKVRKNSPLYKEMVFKDLGVSLVKSFAYNKKTKKMSLFKRENKMKFDEETYDKDDDKGDKDETDFPSHKEMLDKIEKIAKQVAKLLLKQTKDYSKLHFQQVQKKFRFKKQPYESRLVFQMFNEPSDINPETDTKYLVAIQRILVTVDGIMFDIEDDAIKNILPDSENMLQTLDKFIPRLVVNAKDYTWKPQDTTYSQLESDADLMKKSDWPTLLKDPTNINKTRKLLINLTIIKQLAIAMTHLRNAARALKDNY